MAKDQSDRDWETDRLRREKAVRSVAKDGCLSRRKGCGERRQALPRLSPQKTRARAALRHKDELPDFQPFGPYISNPTSE